jgi:hypothetical protein
MTAATRWCVDLDAGPTARSSSAGQLAVHRRRGLERREAPEPRVPRRF